MEKETILQFGTGRFLRGFVDAFVDEMNRKNLYSGKIVVVQPTSGKTYEDINRKNGRYHLIVQGISGGKTIDEIHEIHSISRAVSPYYQFNEYLKLAENPDLRVILSNTTELGITYLGTERLTDQPAESFPAKLTQFLYRRFQLGLPGFLIFPCELIDHNADLLRQYVLKYSELWNLEDAFLKWVKTENHFCNTLVDRICTGYPSEEKEMLQKRIGCDDSMVNVVEPFHLWAIEGNYEEELPFQAAGCHVVWTDDVAPYKKRKVRILNGGHTSMVLGASLYGLESVLECMNDQLVKAVLEHCIFSEIIPAMGSANEDLAFGKAVLERFSNPFLCHHLSDIAVNSVSKFRVRILPTIREYEKKFGTLPMGLILSLAELIVYYQKNAPVDLPQNIESIRTGSLQDILKNTDLWGEDLSDWHESVLQYYDAIQNKGMQSVYEDFTAKISEN
jgi:tagaturonate reductase